MLLEEFLSLKDKILNWQIKENVKMLTLSINEQ